MSATLTVVPAGNPAGLTPMSLPPANSMRVPSASASSRVSSSNRETAAIVGKASPRNPRVAIESRSSADLSLLVAWRSNARSASSCDIPWPSSITRIMRLPPTSTSTRIVFAPASMAFSRSSFTTDAGRSTTSPAAILFATASGSMRIRLISFGGFLLFLNSNPQLVELISVHGRRRIGHQILSGGGFREGDDFADGFFASQEHDHTVDAQRDAAVRRGAVGQRVEEKAEAAAQLFFTKAERFEQALLNVLAVDSDAAGAELVAVQNEVVAFGAHFPRRGFEFIQVFVDNAGEGMLRADPGFVGFTPLEQRKAGEPQEFPLRFVDHAERLAKMQAQLARD